MSRRAAVLCLALGLAPAARAGDITLFLSRASPGETWGTGAGVGVATTWFTILTLEGEVARQPGELFEGSMLSFTGSALLSPAIGSFVPYGGLGWGLYRQSVDEFSETGSLRAFVAGAKLRLGGVLVIKGEYRKLDFSGVLPVDSRWSLGAGLVF